MMSFMREGGGQSVQVCVVGSSKTEALAQIVRKIDAITCCASSRNQKEGNGKESTWCGGFYLTLSDGSHH